MPTNEMIATGLDQQADGHGWIDLLLLLAGRRRLLVLTGVLSAVAAVAIAFLLPDTYTAQTVILPPQESQSLLPAIMGQLGGLAGLGRDMGMKNLADLYAAIVQSETVETALVRRFGLTQLYDQRRVVDARKRLEQLTTVTVLPKEGLVQVEVTDRDARRAAEMANAYIEELFQVNSRLALTDAAQRRIFFEQQLHDAREALTGSEVRMKNTQESTGMLQLDSQARAVIQAVSDLKAEIAAKEVQLRAMKTFATDRNAQVVVAHEELAGLRAQMQDLQTRGGGDGDTQIATKRVPAVALNYLRSFRDLSFQEALYELLMKQYEAARIDEAKSAPLIQVIDHATPPEKRTGPHRSWIIAGGVAGAEFLAAIALLIADAHRRYVANPDNHARVTLLKSYLRG